MFQIFGDVFLCGARFEETLVLKGSMFHNVGTSQTTGMGVEWGWSGDGKVCLRVGWWRNAMNIQLK